MPFMYIYSCAAKTLLDHGLSYYVEKVGVRGSYFSEDMQYIACIIIMYSLSHWYLHVCYELAAGTCKLAHSIDNINGIYAHSIIHVSQ